jgi:hypothetical protein
VIEFGDSLGIFLDFFAFGDSLGILLDFFAALDLVHWP